MVKKNDDWLTMILVAGGAILAGIFGIKAIQNSQDSTSTPPPHKPGCNKCPFS